MKRCPKCDINKQLSEFGKHKQTKDGLKNYCRKCNNASAKAYQDSNREKVRKTNREYSRNNKDANKARSKAWYESNKDKALENSKKWQQENRDKTNNYKLANRHKRRAMIKESGVYLVTGRDLSKIRRQSCVYCGSKDDITIEHIIPITRGGTHSIGNLTSACRSCNFSKSGKFIMEWRIRSERKDL
jgi:5-methylcytosine-specific restriction endonuclease McrA